MKNLIIHILQKILGFEMYLFVFAIFIINKLKWDKNEKDFLKIFELIEEDGLILDIGANIGVMTVHFARKLKNSLIFAFEPIPYNIRTLRKIVTFYRLSNVKILDIALGDENADLQMIMPVIGSAKKHGLSHVIKYGDPNDETGERFNVKCKRLDDMEEITQSAKRITALKIDVEGFELNVFRGASETISKHKPVIYCELWPGEQQNDTIEFIRSLGYIPKVNIKGRLINYNGQSCQNFFFIPKTSGQIC